MRHFPVDVPKSQAIKTLEKLGFRVIREGNHISLYLSLGIVLGDRKCRM